MFRLTIPSCRHSWLIVEFVTRVIRRVSLVVQELLSIPDHLRSSLVFLWGSCWFIFSCLCSVLWPLFVILSFLCLHLFQSFLQLTHLQHHNATQLISVMYKNLQNSKYLSCTKTSKTVNIRNIHHKHINKFTKNLRLSLRMTK